MRPDLPFSGEQQEATLSRFYGKGVFTTIAVAGSRPLFWEKHWKRLTANAEKLDIDISKYLGSVVENALSEKIVQGKLLDGRARITFVDESQAKMWAKQAVMKTRLLISTAAPHEVPKNLRVTVSPYLVNSTSPLAGIKSCNYLENLLAVDEARRRGFFEAIRLNQKGEVTSACMANVFWIKDGTIFTPSLETGCLAGTTREFVLENFECFEVEAELDALDAADAIFLTSAGIGIRKVAELNGRPIGNDQPYSILGLWPLKP